MKYKNLANEDKKLLASELSNNKIIDVCERYKIPKRTMYDWKKKLKEDGYDIDGRDIDPKETHFSKETIEAHKLKEENRALKKALKEAKNEMSSSDEIRELVEGVSKVKLDTPLVPEWVATSSKKKNNIVPVLCLSDIHMGEVVEPEEVNFVNEYNSDIAKERVHQCVDDFIDIYKNKMSNYEYDGVVVVAPGDNTTNSLHDLAEFNDNSPIDQIIEVVVLFQEVLLKLEKAFGNVVMFATSGNHGRLQPKGYTKTKGRFNNSLEKIVYHFLEVNMKETKVSIITDPSDIVRFSINGKRFRLEHGDSIKSAGTAIAGPVTGWERARLKKSAIDSSTNNKFDTLVIGHFHTHHIQGESMIVCNSPKGFDEFCQMLSIPYAPPGCTSFSVNNHGQIIFATDIQCRDGIQVKPRKNHIELF